MEKVLIVIKLANTSEQMSKNNSMDQIQCSRIAN
jgi:hypothetical protein